MILLCGALDWLFQALNWLFEALDWLQVGKEQGRKNLLNFFVLNAKQLFLLYFKLERLLNSTYFEIFYFSLAWLPQCDKCYVGL